MPYRLRSCCSRPKHMPAPATHLIHRRVIATLNMVIKLTIHTPQSVPSINYRIFSVIVARILRKSNRRINNHHIYKIDIVKTYKTSEKAQQYLKQSRLITAPNDGLCGINFSELELLFWGVSFCNSFIDLPSEIGQLYAIAGNSQKVGLCQYIKEYSKMSQVEKRGIAGAYKKGCGCEVSFEPEL